MENNKEWLAGLDVGAEVAVRIEDVNYLYYIGTVEKRTPKQITVKGTVYKLNAEGTVARCRGLSHDLVPVTDEIRALAKAQRKWTSQMLA